MSDHLCTVPDPDCYRCNLNRNELDVESAANRVKAERPLSWSDLFGIDPEYTEGVPVDEWLESNRGDA